MDALQRHQTISHQAECIQYIEWGIFFFDRNAVPHLIYLFQQTGNLMKLSRHFVGLLINSMVEIKKILSTILYDAIKQIFSIEQYFFVKKKIIPAHTTSDRTLRKTPLLKSFSHCILKMAAVDSNMRR